MIERIGQWKLNRHTGNTYLRSAMLSLKSPSDWTRLSRREREAIRNEDYVYAQVLGRYGTLVIPVEAVRLHTDRKRGLPVVVKSYSESSDSDSDINKIVGMEGVHKAFKNAESVTASPDEYSKILYDEDTYLDYRDMYYSPDDETIDSDDLLSIDDDRNDYYGDEDRSDDEYRDALTAEEIKDLFKEVSFERYGKNLALALESQRQADSAISGRIYTQPLHNKSVHVFFQNMRDGMLRYVNNLPHSKLLGMSRQELVKAMLDAMINMMQQGLLSPSSAFFDSDRPFAIGEDRDMNELPQELSDIYAYVKMEVSARRLQLPISKRLAKATLKSTVACASGFGALWMWIRWKHGTARIYLRS